MQTGRDARVTVLMPMRNAAEFLPAAMKSIMDQTLRDFTFLVIDDGSGDNSVEIAKALADGRTRVVGDGRHLGIAARLNWGLREASTPLVARMDADDIAAPNRLARQLAFMDDNPDVAICGTWYKAFETAEPVWEGRLPERHDDLRAMTLFASPLAHPTVMMRPGRLRDAGLEYDEALDAAEDYDLWERACSRVTLANLPEFLLLYRLHPGQVTTARPVRQRRASDAIRRRALRRFGIAFSEEEFALHCDFAGNIGMDDPQRAREALAWLRKLGRTARQRGDSAVAAACASRSKSLRRQARRARRKSSRPGILRRLLKAPR